MKLLEMRIKDFSEFSEGIWGKTWITKKIGKVKIRFEKNIFLKIVIWLKIQIYQNYQNYHHTIFF